MKRLLNKTLVVFAAVAVMATLAIDSASAQRPSRGGGGGSIGGGGGRFQFRITIKRWRFSGNHLHKRLLQTIGFLNHLIVVALIIHKVVDIVLVDQNVQDIVQIMVTDQALDTTDLVMLIARVLATVLDSEIEHTSVTTTFTDHLLAFA